MISKSIVTENIVLLTHDKESDTYFIEYVADSGATVPRVPCTEGFYNEAHAKQLTRQKAYVYTLHTNRDGFVYAYDRKPNETQGFRFLRNEDISSADSNSSSSTAPDVMVVTVDNTTDEIAFIRPFASVGTAEKQKIMDDILKNKEDIEADDTICGKYLVSEIRNKRGVTSYYLKQ